MLIYFSPAAGWSQEGVSAALVGVKALNIASVPEPWRPPFFVVPTSVYVRWRQGTAEDRKKICKDAGERIAGAAIGWASNWSRGLILRSSSSTETLGDRGTFLSLSLAADYGGGAVGSAIADMFEHFEHSRDSSELAILVQPLIAPGRVGHLSNERRVSKTINQWAWEQQTPTLDSGRLNSQRDPQADTSNPLEANGKNKTVRLFGSVGQWLNSLGRGPCHVEWIHQDRRLWIVQVDFENEAPDDGVDPERWFRHGDFKPATQPDEASVLKTVDLHVGQSPWPKIRNIEIFARCRSEPFPSLATITGQDLLASAGNDSLRLDIEAFAHGRVVCRTDCSNPDIPRLNMPRTHTVSSFAAVASMLQFLDTLLTKGAAPAEVCFILHKFIPARAGAWAHADPASQIITIDGLWGVPDGLQYLPHDTFEFDVKNSAETASRIRYKPRFIQECDDGSWQELKVRRTLARHRSIGSLDIREIATVSHAIAKSLGKPLLIMWFSGIPTELGIGRNLPWFRMAPPERRILESPSAAPRLRRRRVRTVSDLHLASDLRSKETLVLEPAVELIRDDENFLLRVIELALQKDLPVELAGSRLSHAYYQLEKSGVKVVQADEPRWSRVRRKQSFAKLVRDSIPERIERGGETVVQAQLSRTELRPALVAKLLEEAHELLIARDPTEIEAELGDLLEIIRAIAHVTGVDWNDVQRSADKKRQERGGFEEGTVLLETFWPTAAQSSAKSGRQIPLRSLARITQEQEGVTASFNALVANLTDGVEISFAERRVLIRISRNGITVSDSTSEGDMGDQLEFSFA